MSLRLAFMGTPDFAVPVLEALVGAGHAVERVYAQPPARAGRGKAVRPSPVQAAAEAMGLPVDTPPRFADVETEFAALGLDAAVVVAYGQVLRADALGATRLGCFNLHASLLPRWRGAAPIQRAIMSGDSETGLCVMRMELGLDTGPILGCVRTPISATDTAGALQDRLAALGAPLMVSVLAELEAGTAEAVPQPAHGITYAKKIEKAEARIDWAQSAEALSAHIRGLAPFPGAWFETGGTRVKVLLASAEAWDGPPIAPGTVLDGGALLVSAQAGAVRLQTLQKAGRGALSAADFLRGLPLPPGTELG